MVRSVRRVVVTGLGLVCALGNTVEDSWQALLAGRSGSGPISLFDAGGHPTRFACEVRGLDVSAYARRLGIVGGAGELPFL